jgi:hypothetical protein
MTGNVRFPVRVVPTALLCLVGALGSATPARADNIDDELLEQASTLLDDLRDKYQNIGVLKFRVQKGEQAASFDVGLLNANMAARLENALILSNDVKKPVGIARVATASLKRLIDAGQGADASYLKPETRKALFDGDYPLAWGSKKVKVDAFLTGEVILSKDLKKTTVVVECFGPNDPALRKLLDFTVKTDRNILADTGASFSLVRRSVSLLRRGDELDEEAVAYAALKKDDPKAEEGAFDSLLSFDVFYGDEKQKVQPIRDGLERLVPEPKPGQEVRFELKNRTTEKLGVVLRVNGINTLHKEAADRPIEQYTRWVLAPNTPYSIRGFYVNDGTKTNCQKFDVRSPRGMSNLDPDKLGLIEIDLFRAGGLADDPSLRSRNVNLRGMPKSTEEPKTLAELKSELRKAVALKGKESRGAILPGDTVENVKLTPDSFENPVHVGSAVIRYFQ